MRLFFDLETAPGSAAYLHREAEDATKPSAAIKKPEALAKWEAEDKPAAVDENFRRFALAAETGEIISIAAVADDDAEFVLCRSPSESEADLLADFFAWVTERQEARMVSYRDASGRDWPVEPEGVHLVAHNAAFDVPYLRGRCIALGVKPSFRLPSALDRMGKAYSCTMLLWAGFGGRVSLRRLALALGLPDPKGELDGAGVFDAWQAGRIAEIAAYNLNDARTVKGIFERMQAVGVAA
jgi:3'-5' exonuclease